MNLAGKVALWTDSNSLVDSYEVNPAEMEVSRNVEPVHLDAVWPTKRNVLGQLRVGLVSDVLMGLVPVGLTSRTLFWDFLYSIHELHWIQECDWTAKAEREF